MYLSVFFTSLGTVLHRMKLLQQPFPLLGSVSDTTVAICRLCFENRRQRLCLAPKGAVTQWWHTKRQKVQVLPCSQTLLLQHRRLFWKSVENYIRIIPWCNYKRCLETNPDTLKIWFHTQNYIDFQPNWLLLSVLQAFIEAVPQSMVFERGVKRAAYVLPKLSVSLRINSMTNASW